MSKRPQKLSIDMLPKEVRIELDRKPFEMGDEEDMVAVRIIRDNGPAALVEWGEPHDLRRAYVPKEVIHDLRAPAGELEAGASYGVRWEEFAAVTATPERIGQELRLRGIWTIHDFETRLAEAQSAFFAAYGADFGALLRAARKHEEQTL